MVAFLLLPRPPRPPDSPPAGSTEPDGPSSPSVDMRLTTLTPATTYNASVSQQSCLTDTRFVWWSATRQSVFIVQCGVQCSHCSAWLNPSLEFSTSIRPSARRRVFYRFPAATSSVLDSCEVVFLVVVVVVVVVMMVVVRRQRQQTERTLLAYRAAQRCWLGGGRRREAVATMMRNASTAQ